jgi:hypothetical protein
LAVERKVRRGCVFTLNVKFAAVASFVSHSISIGPSGNVRKA